MHGPVPPSVAFPDAADLAAQLVAGRPTDGPAPQDGTWCEACGEVHADGDDEERPREVVRDRLRILEWLDNAEYFDWMVAVQVAGGVLVGWVVSLERGWVDLELPSGEVHQLRVDDIASVRVLGALEEQRLP